MSAANKSKMTFRTDGNFAIHVTDLPKAENFYTNVLGFNLIDKSEQQLIYETGTICLYVNKDEKVIPFILPQLDISNFTGREDELKQLEKQIFQEGRSRIAGIVGVTG